MIGKEKKINNDMVNIPIIASTLTMREIEGHFVDENALVHIKLQGDYELVFKDKIGNNPDSNHMLSVKEAHADIKFKNKKGWILKTIIVDDKKNDIIIGVSPISMINMDENMLTYNLGLIDNPFRKTKGEET